MLILVIANKMCG